MKSHFFKAQYYIDKRFDNFYVEEAWIENVWYYMQNLGVVTKEANERKIQLVFKLKQIPAGGFLLKDYSNWKIYDSTSDNYVGTTVYHKANGKQIGVYYLEMA